MSQLVPLARPHTPAIIAAAGERASYRFLEFFAAQIRNPHTRRSYIRATADFMAWLEGRGMADIRQINSVVIALYVEQLQERHPAPTVKQRLAAIRKLLDWLATGGVLEFNPATAVRGPRHSVKKGKTPVLAPDEARQLLDSIDVSTPIGLRDRALIGLMVYSFARIGAAIAMTVEDIYIQNRRLWVRLQEKGGKQHDMPCHHNLEEYLVAYLDGCDLRRDPKGPLFRTIGRGTHALTQPPPAPAQRLCHGSQAGRSCRNRHQHREPKLPGHRDHGISKEWRCARAGGDDGQSCFHQDHPAL